ncbi:MAG: right-handed parallel beta-helix repeat-containing protein, partial [Terriglobia bacterium]
MNRRDFVRFSSLSATSPWLARIGNLFRSNQLNAKKVGSAPVDHTFHVSVDGNDRNPGTQARPFASLSRARDAIRSLRRSAPIQVLVRAGTYYLPEPLVFGPQDSGTLDAPITYAAAPGEIVTLSGGRKITGHWQPYRNGILQCHLPSRSLRFTQLFVNGKRQIRARYPNYDPQNPRVSGRGYVNAAGPIPDDVPAPHPDPDQDMSFAGSAPRGIAFNPQTFTPKPWARPQEAVIHIFQAYYWGNLQWQLQSVDRTNYRLWFGRGGWQIGAKWSANPCAVNHHSRFYIENVFEELDAPGEWYLDEKAAVLYAMPEEGVDMAAARVEAPVLEQVVKFEGTEEEPVHDVVLKGFRIAHTRSTFLDQYETPSLSDWSIHRGGAVMLEGARNCRVEDCWFDAVGGNGAFLNRYNRGNVVTGCKFTESGDSAICLVGAQETTNGTRRDFPYECQATNNLIHDCGVFGKQIAGVYISRAKRITVGHNL